jgi:hypothetical protein
MRRTAEKNLSDVLVGKTIRSTKYSDNELIIEFTDDSRIKLSSYHDMLSVFLRADDWNSTPEMGQEAEYRRHKGIPYPPENIYPNGQTSGTI